MKIAHTGLSLPEGKTRYNDPIVSALVDKFQPAKISPYYVEFMPGAYEEAEAIVTTHHQILELLIPEIERLEARSHRAEDDAERRLLSRALAELENETPLCDADLDPDERGHLLAVGALTLKPTLVLDDPDLCTDDVCTAVLDKAAKMFFYTAGKQEVHAWLVNKGASALSCADRIHSDLARGFIKAEIVSFDDLMKTHNMRSANTEGLTRLLDRDDPIQENTVLEIRFNV